MTSRCKSGRRRYQATFVAPRPDLGRHFRCHQLLDGPPHDLPQRVSLEVYSRLALSDAQEQYDAVIDRFPV
jgi:hypothetical protein